MIDRLIKVLTYLFDQFLLLYSIFLLGLFITDYAFILKDGISNFSIQALFFLALLGFRWFMDKQTFKNTFLIRIIKYLSKFQDNKLLIFIFFAFIIIFSAIGISRHLAFSSSGCDLAVTDQAIWNTTKGDILFSSLDGNISHFGAHFEPVLFLIAPLYLFWPNVLVLVILQILALGLAIFPLYLIAKQRLNNRLLIFVFILAYFLSRSVRGIGLLDFHTDSFLVPLALFSFYFLVTNRTKYALLTLFSMLLCKENASFLLAGFGLFTFFSLKKRKLGIVLIASGITSWYIITSIVMPYFASTKDYPYLVWLPFGKTYSENIIAVVKNPAVLLNLIFGQGKIDFYIRLFAPVGFLAFLSPRHYVLFLAPLALQIVGSIGHPGMQTISSHYPAHTLPFIFISAIYGAGWLIERFSKKDPAKYKKAGALIACLVLLTSISFYGKSDGHKLSKFIKSIGEIKSREIAVALKTIPQGASVCAVNRLVPHLSHRKYIYLWKSLADFKYNCEYVAIHTDLWDRQEDINKIILTLEGHRYNLIYTDKDKLFFIFFNKTINKNALENEPKKINPME